METSIEFGSVAVLGCGAMGTALVQGWLKNIASTHSFHLHVHSETSLLQLQKKLEPLAEEAKSRIASTQSGNDGLVAAASAAEVVILACPPGELSTAVGQKGFVEAIANKTLISLLAGVSFNMIRQAIESTAGGRSATDLNIQIARVMPSLGAVMGESVTMIAVESGSSTEDDRVNYMFSQVGTIIHLPEKYMNKATALGAVCHALAIMSADTASDASAAEGLPRPLAKDLAAKCFKSCGSMMDQGMTPEQLKDAMAVPRGITINAVLNLEKAARSNIASAVRDAIQYAERMA